LIEGQQAAELRQRVLEIAAGLESLSYWLDCMRRERRAPPKLSGTLH
jgi:hypothetical protein